MCLSDYLHATMIPFGKKTPYRWLAPMTCFCARLKRPLLKQDRSLDPSFKLDRFDSFKNAKSSGDGFPSKIGIHLYQIKVPFQKKRCQPKNTFLGTNIYSNFWKRKIIDSRVLFQEIRDMICQFPGG